MADAALPAGAAGHPASAETPLRRAWRKLRRNRAALIGGTIVLGLVGSLVGGFIGYLIFHKDSANGAFQMSGFLGSIVGSVLVLLAWRAYNSRTAVH